MKKFFKYGKFELKFQNDISNEDIYTLSQIVHYGWKTEAIPLPKIKSL